MLIKPTAATTNDATAIPAIAPPLGFELFPSSLPGLVLSLDVGVGVDVDGGGVDPLFVASYSNAIRVDSCPHS